MSTRNSFPKAQLPRSHYFITLARGEDAKCFSIKPWLFYTVGAALPACALLIAASSALFVFRDEMLASLMQRQSEMQVAYEDRLAAMRMQIDRVTSSQLLDQNSIEARMHELISRQARLENRAAVVATLAGSAGLAANAGLAGAQIPAQGVSSETTGSIKAQAKAGSPVNPLLQLPVGKPLPGSVSAYAPAGGPMIGTPGFQIMPRPGPVEVQPDPRERGRPAQGAMLRDPQAAAAADPNLPPELRLGALAQSLDRIEREQVRSVSAIAAKAKENETRLRQVIAATGLPADKMQATSGAAGGPFVPFKLDPNGTPFEREVLRMQGHVAAADKLRRIAAQLPLRKPLSGDPEITSGYGSRIDPFNGRLASHTGIDFRMAYGSLVRATAAGTIVTASYNGGYGQMVEIDHGNGVTSRYAHLSAIIVKSGQSVSPGTIIGRLGSTGRSTGPHLHYEVRHNDNPLDPRRFLAAGAKLSGS